METLEPEAAATGSMPCLSHHAIPIMTARLIDWYAFKR